MRFLALYLPQFHETAENNEWWGKGYTEWTAVKNAKPLFKGHEQPRVPLDNNYYDLSDENGTTWKWQAEMAKKYGIYGFCIYHYWFGKKQLLEKPMEILLNHPEIDIHYCICWANESWRRNWYDRTNAILLEQTYGDSDEWERHYRYLSSFFHDSRYIKVDNRPLVNIYKQSDVHCLDEMLCVWNDLAIKDGFEGLFVVASLNSIGNGEIKSKHINAIYCFEPGYSTRNSMSLIEKTVYFGSIAIRHCYNLVFRKDIIERINNLRTVNMRIIRSYSNLRKKYSIPVFAGACPQWDNTPRRGASGSVYTNSTPEQFGSLLSKLKTIVPQSDFVYINAWNEWGEGCYLEPDEKHKFEYLEAIKRILNE